jgi:hypothetical protein
MAFGQNYNLKGFSGVEGVADYEHAAKTFLTNGYEFAPRHKYLFHVYFTINTAYVPALRTAFANNQEIATIGLMVKNVQLPNYNISVEQMNQYNRKRLVQTKIDYQPVQFEFHDDGGDLIRDFWYSYYSYYYKDPSQKYDNLANNNGSLGPLIGTPNGFSYNSRDIYDNTRTVNDWGYIGESYTDGADIFGVGNTGKLPFFKDIRIFGFNQHKWASYILINPLITEWQHDTYDYSQSNGTMSNRMTIRYETVKYGTGAIGDVRPDTNAVGFADPSYYDTLISGITRPGTNATVFGQGGLIDTGVGIAEDLASGGVAGYIGAAQKAIAAYNTYKDKDLASVANQEVKTSAKAVAKGALPAAQRAVIGTPGTPGVPGTGQRGVLDGIFFPTPPKGDTRGNATSLGTTATQILNQGRTG